MKKKHFKRRTKFKVVLGALVASLILSIIEAFIPASIISVIISSIIISICYLLLLFVLFDKPDYDFHVEYDSPYVIFRKSENDVRAFFREYMKIERKDNHYLIVSDDTQRMLIPYNEEIEKFLEELI